MEQEAKYIKVIHFDLSIAELRKFGLQTKAYSILRKELKDQGFKRRQYSGYISIKPMDSQELIKCIKPILQRNPWILQCAQKIDASNVIKDIVFDIKDVFDKKNRQNTLFDKGKKAERNPADSTDEEKTQKEDGYKRLADSINKDKAKERLDKIKNKSKSNSDEHIR